MVWSKGEIRAGQEPGSQPAGVQFDSRREPWLIPRGSQTLQPLSSVRALGNLRDTAGEKGQDPDQPTALPLGLSASVTWLNTGPDPALTCSVPCWHGTGHSSDASTLNGKVQTQETRFHALCSQPAPTCSTLGSTLGSKAGSCHFSSTQLSSGCCGAFPSSFLPSFFEAFFLFFFKANKIQPCLQSRDHLSQAQLSTRNKLIKTQIPPCPSPTQERKNPAQQTMMRQP